MRAIPSRIRKRLEALPCWRGDHIQLAGTWQPLKRASKQADSCCGLYALGLENPVMYDGKQTRIVYIGSSTRLGKRLRQHVNSPQNLIVCDMKTLCTDDLLATYWQVPELPERWVRALEGEALWTFNRVFGCVPLCNRDIPESNVSELCTGLIRIMPEPECAECLTLAQLAERMGRIVIRQSQRPIGDPREICVSFSMTPDGEFQCGTPEFTVLEFRSPSEVACPPQDEAATMRDTGEDLVLSFVCEGQVALWSVEKMRELRRICAGLRRDESGRKTQVFRYLVDSPKPPKGHTWGEVALVQGRICSGSLSAPQRIWIKVLHEKVLLGQAFLQADRFHGEDMADLPQSKDPRPNKWELLDTVGDTEESSQYDADLALLSKQSRAITKRMDHLYYLEEKENAEIKGQLRGLRHARKEIDDRREMVIREKLQADAAKRYSEAADIAEALFEQAH